MTSETQQLPALPQLPSYDEMKKSQRVIEEQQRQLSADIKQLQLQVKEFQTKGSSGSSNLGEIRKRQAELSKEIKELTARSRELENVFKDPEIEEIRNRIKPLPLNQDKIEEKISDLDAKFQHTTLTGQEEKQVRTELSVLKKALLEVEKIDFFAIEEAKQQHLQLLIQKKPLIQEQMALRAQYDEEIERQQKLRDENSEQRQGADAIWEQIKQKQAERNQLQAKHQQIFDEFKAQREEYDRIRALHDQARKASQDLRKQLEPIAKKLQEFRVRYQENPPYSCQYDIQQPNYAELTDAAEEEFSRAQLVQWIDSQLQSVEGVKAVSQQAAVEAASKDQELALYAKKDRQQLLKEKKEKKQKQRNVIDYSGFEFFGACGLKFSDYDTPEKLAELRVQLSSGGEQLKQEKEGVIKHKVETVLAELVASGGQWKWVEKVEFVRRDFDNKRFDKRDGTQNERRAPRKFDDRRRDEQEMEQQAVTAE